MKCVESIPIAQFLNMDLPIFGKEWFFWFTKLDVRSPSEYKQGRIPGAFSLPLFTDEERKQVGIIYKNVGKSEAVLQGM